MITRNLTKSTSANDKQTTLKYRIWVADIEDVDVENWPKAVNATISVNPLLTGKTWKYMDVKADSIKPSAAPGESPFGGKLTLTPVVEGLSKQTLSWLYENVGKDVVVVWERCSDGVRFIGGSPCSNGMRIKFTSIGAQDGGVSGIALSFEGGECPEPLCFYEGELPVAAPTAIEVTDSAITIGSAYGYLIKDNAAATSITSVSGVTDADLGRQIQLSGAGVTYPATIANSATFILANGVSFSAAVGNTIILLIGKSGSAYTFTEVYRG